MVGSYQDKASVRLLLHVVLIAGALVFSFPFLWMIGTSVMLDREIFSKELRILPERPVPRPVSPYVWEGAFAKPMRPAAVPEEAWSAVRPAVSVRLREAFTRVAFPRRDDVPAALLDEEILQGLWQRLRGRMPPDRWQQSPDALGREVAGWIDEEIVRQTYKTARRKLVLGAVRPGRTPFTEWFFEGEPPATELWKVMRGDVRIDPDDENPREAIVSYDLTRRPEAVFALTAPSPRPADEITRLRLALFEDESWNRLFLRVRKGGKWYKAEEVVYLSESQWTEITLQEPSVQDIKPSRHEYVRILEQSGEPAEDDGQIHIEVTLRRSGNLHALWGKATRSYRKSLKMVPFWQYVMTSIALVILNVIGTMFASSLVAYAFARLHWPGRNLCFVLVLATLMIPPQVIMIPAFMIFRSLGWYNSLLPLWVPALFGNAFFIFLLRQFMKGIPVDLEDAAKIDGCGFFGIYWHVMLPLVKPTLAAVAIFTFMNVWNDFMGPLIYVNDQRLYPLALGLFSFQAERATEFGMTMAGSFLMTAPVIAVFFVAQRQFIQGVTLTGLKG